MNKKEISEIRKQFTPANCAISRICGCYVDHEKNKKFETKSAFLTLPEEEEFKYFDIFKHTLGGTLGKHLVNMEFPLEQEMPGGTQEFLLKLRNTELQDDELVSAFYDKIIENYIYDENYYIILIYASYDIPGKTSDNLEMFDASDEVYSYLLCSICPVKMSKACLSYNQEENCMEDHIRDWLVEMPVNGFLFPAFNDRGADLHSLLFFAKKPEDAQDLLIEIVFGSTIPLTPKTQQETFQSIIENSLGEDADYELVRDLYENIADLVEETKEAPDPLQLTKPEMRQLLENSGATEEQVESFDKTYDEMAGEQTALQATNITNPKSFEISTPNIQIKVDPACTDLIETRVIDGRQCLVITVDDHVEINGMNVRTIRRNQEQGRDDSVQDFSE